MPAVAVSSPSPSTIRAYLLDVAGLAFVGAAIYIGVVHGVSNGDFAAFAALAGAYLGIKS